MRYLLRSLGHDERPALFLIPLAWNAHLFLGFLNFIAAIPLCLVGLGIAAHLRRGFTVKRAIALAAVALVTFYMHVVPFAFLGLGAALVAVGDGVVDTMKRWVPLAPAAIAALIWSEQSPAGQSTMVAMSVGDAGAGPQPQFLDVRTSARRPR